MGYKDITAGDKIGRATASRFIKAKSGKVAIEIIFEFDNNGTKEMLPWQGWLSEKAMERTMETLVDVLDFNGDDSILQVPEGDPRSGHLSNQDAINRQKDVRLLVEIEEYTKENGEIGRAPKIKFVNKIGGSGFVGITPEVLKNELAASGFKAAFLALKASSPVKSQPQQQTKPAQAPQQNLNTADVPW